MATIDCICPPKAGETRHPGGDTVTLRERLDFVAGRTARNIVRVMRGDNTETQYIVASITEWLMLTAIASWSVVDAKGKPVEPTQDNIREYLLPNDLAADAVANEVDAAFMEAVLAPLANEASKSLPDTPTEESTSQTNGSSPKPRKPSKPSSTTTTRTDGIISISSPPGGGSSSSLSSA